MLKGFFDESGTSKNDAWFILAGWVCPVEQWERFSDAWYEALTTHPTIGYFKISEANQLGGEFSKFSREQSDAKKLLLAEVISRFQLRGYVATGEHRLLLNKPKEHKGLMTTRMYDWAFMALVPTVLWDQLENLHRSDKVDFVFDGCNELRACQESYARRKLDFPKPMRSMAGEVSPGDDKELAGLQAADFLAGEISNLARNKRSDHITTMLNGSFLIPAPVILPASFNCEMKKFADYYESKSVLNRIFKKLKTEGISVKPGSEFNTFNEAMDTILRANPQIVKAAMEEEKKERAAKRLASDPSSSNRDA